MPDKIVRVDFQHFKTHESLVLHLKHFNILVGPNNAGKSTILAAFRILASAMRKALSRKPEMVRGPQGLTSGYNVDLKNISIAEENIFYNYDESTPAIIRFSFSNGNALTLYFAEIGSCVLVPEVNGRPVSTPSRFKSEFDCTVSFVPILGPVEHHEPLYEKEAARLALYNYRAARNFRNIWYHYPEEFDRFRELLKSTWPGMDIERPEVDRTHDKPRLHMYCPENRRPREIFWSGFGFQVWCQMLTHLIQSDSSTLFLIDEPDIYLHSDLQRQLLNLLRGLGPDILVATHSTEIISEAEIDDIIVLNKGSRNPRRLRSSSQLVPLFDELGSSSNPLLTQLAKTRRVVFVEGLDFRLLSKFARRSGFNDLASQGAFAVVKIEGFNPERVRSFKTGIEAALGTSISSAAILDRDYRCDSECASIRKKLLEICDVVTIHDRKEIENFLLVPSAIDRAFSRRAVEQSARSSSTIVVEPFCSDILERFSSQKKSYITSQFIHFRKTYERSSGSSAHESKINEIVLDEIEREWANNETRLKLLPGKEALSFINAYAQDKFSISITAISIIDAMKIDEVPKKMIHLLTDLDNFSRTNMSD